MIFTWITNKMGGSKMTILSPYNFAYIIIWPPSLSLIYKPGKFLWPASRSVQPTALLA